MFVFISGKTQRLFYEMTLPYFTINTLQVKGYLPSTGSNYLSFTSFEPILQASDSWTSTYYKHLPSGAFKGILSKMINGNNQPVYPNASVEMTGITSQGVYSSF